MRKNKWSYVKAFEHVKSKRNAINPNQGFITQLQKYQLELKIKTIK